MSILEALRNSNQLINWLGEKVDGLDLQNNHRHRVAGAQFHMAMDCHCAIVLLIQNSLPGPAFSLIRPMFESFVRGAWIQECADDNIVENYVAQIEIGGLEKDRFPKRLGCLIEDLKLNRNMYTTLLYTKENSLDAMHSYVHSGYQQVVHRQTETSIESNFSDDEQTKAIRFANTFGCWSAIAICNLSNRADVEEAIRETLDEHMSVAFCNNVGRASSK